jgi:hypothetical protein
MSENADKEEKKEYHPRSGQIAVKMKFITPEQLKEALIEQIDDDLAGRPHRFLGEILVKNNWITLEQLDIILHELFSDEMKARGKL